MMTDAFGQQLYDQHRGIISSDYREVGERDDGYIRVYDHPRWYFTTSDEWDPHLQKAMGYVQGRTLDIGCGAGRVTLHLQERGLNVVGIDSSPLAIQVCNERGIHDARLLSVTQISLKKLGMFDSVVLTGNNFGLFGNPVRAKSLLQRLFKMTTDNARIITETTDPYTTNDLVDLSYQERNRAKGRMSGQYRHRERYLNLKGPWFDWLFVSRDEMREIVKGTGWTIDKFVEPEGSQYVGILEKVTGWEIDT
ncbi:MAG: class I SAM-dependent methyltransferase [Chloroflexi bacterium]|nr:class I SAM-dependent methyltransferase [Chloroflexota bacterium]MCY3638545.1 class I SAM-dependent methyltransferase [Chloroflexota bacterium]